MSRIIAAKEAEVEDMREAADGTVVRLRALIERKASLSVYICTHILLHISTYIRLHISTHVR